MLQAAELPLNRRPASDRTVKFEIRKAFMKFGLEPTGDLFDRAYAYDRTPARPLSTRNGSSRTCSARFRRWPDRDVLRDVAPLR